MLIRNNIKGILFLISAVLCFSIMNGITRELSETYNVITLNMFRYWFFAFILILMNNYNKKSTVLISKSKKQYLQIFRGTLLAIQMCFAHYCFLKLGLIETSAIFAIGPIMVTALSIIFLHEKVDWQRLIRQSELSKAVMRRTWRFPLRRRQQMLRPTRPRCFARAKPFVL